MALLSDVFKKKAEEVTETVNCKRCGIPFTPELVEGLGIMSTCCKTCKCRNLFDALGLPTPPSLLDKHTAQPALTEGEFRKLLNEDHNGQH